MTDLRTNERLLAALQQAATMAPPPEEIERQRLSFVMGSLSMDSSMTRNDVREVLDRQRGQAQD